MEKEAESETHFKAVAVLETGRLQQEITKLDKEMEALKEKKEAHENSVSRATEKREKLFDQLNWDQKTLEIWLEDSARKDEDAMAILRYTEQDKSKIMELIHAIDKSSVEVNQKRKALENENTKTITAQWLPDIHKEVRQRQFRVKERKMFLERQMENNAECERKGLRARQLVTRLKGEFQKKKRNCTRLQDDFDSLRVTVESVATDVKATRSQLTSVKKDIQDIQVILHTKIEGMERHKAVLQEKLKSVRETVLSVDERATQMEQMLKEEEQNKMELEAHLHRLHMAQPCVTQELQALRAEEKQMLADLAARRYALSTLIGQRHRAEHQSLKQQEMINSKDFQIQLLERKMVCVKVEENSMQRQVLRRDETKLVVALEYEKKTFHMLGHHLKRLQVEISIVKKLVEKKVAERKDLTVKIEEQNLVNDTSNKELKKLRYMKQDSMVEDNVLKLEVHRLSTILHNKTDKVFSLEKQKLELQTATKEREDERSVHREMLQKNFKIMEQERQKLSFEMNEKICKIDKMRNRYEIMILSMEGTEGEGWSPEYYLVKIEKEKDQLQRVGNELDTKIYKKEEEIQALENTHHGICIRNVEYRRAFISIAKWSKEHQQQLKLEKEKQILEEKSDHKSRQAREMEEEVKAINDAIDSLEKEEVEELEMREKVQFHIEILKKDLGTQKVKLHRVSKQYSNLTREIRSSQTTEDMTEEEQDIQVRELKDLSKAVNSMLHEAVRDNPDLRSALEKRFEEAKLPLLVPLAMSSHLQSSRSSSTRHSVSVRSSISSSVSGLRSSAIQFPHLKKVDLQLVVGNPRASASSSRTSKRDTSSSSSCSSIGSQP
ncbi:hypothetical protein AAFF_G00107540 [Aldrovandia affinis]|uniref:Coiled-coil domain-containing protein 39 n=1 Tax=Aldrovandia affinis TaxID=143900 RepID=A0AAD7WBD4_9TELE|nr:hypothetical protein AAFF_G00107540 [Aldrovandia affinis]